MLQKINFLFTRSSVKPPPNPHSNYNPYPNPNFNLKLNPIPNFNPYPNPCPYIQDTLTSHALGLTAEYAHKHRYVTCNSYPNQ